MAPAAGGFKQTRRQEKLLPTFHPRERIQRGRCLSLVTPRAIRAGAAPLLNASYLLAEKRGERKLSLGCAGGGGGEDVRVAGR